MEKRRETDKGAIFPSEERIRADGICSVKNKTEIGEIDNKEKDNVRK